MNDLADGYPEDMCAEIDRLRDINAELLEVAKIYDHAHETGNSVPPLMVKRFRAAIAKAEGK